MAELEIHHEAEHKIDPAGQKVGVLAALLAVGLAVVTIESHRTHTAAILDNSKANDAWAHYQSTRVKYHNLELGESILAVVGNKGEAADKMMADTKGQKSKYEEQGKQIQEEAKHDEELADSDERRALRYDFGEGLLEIGLVLTSLYFISRKAMFPVMGLIAGLAGIAIAITGLMI
jgi:hypothetical protein